MSSTMLLYGQETTIALSDIIEQGSFRTSLELQHEVSFFVTKASYTTIHNPNNVWLD